MTSSYSSADYNKAFKGKFHRPYPRLLTSSIHSKIGEDRIFKFLNSLKPGGKYAGIYSYYANRNLILAALNIIVKKGYWKLLGLLT